MGIKHLNKYLQDTCNESIKKIHISSLSGKKIVIDTSIYLYRFVGDGCLLENFYLMISIFRQYNIIPLFIFDGKPPKEKDELLKQRKMEKKEAELKYKILEDKLINNIDADINIVEIKENMDVLKKQFIRINHKDIENVKTLIKAYGVSYIEATGEADKLCAKMVCKHKAYACLSEDMDLFVYGCGRVLRYLSLLKKTAIMYDLSGILGEIKMSLNEFQQVTIVSGTDYNHDMKQNTNLMTTIKYFKRYKKGNSSYDFYNWLKLNTNYVDNFDELNKIVNMFTLANMIEYKKYENIKIINGPLHISNLQTIMKNENFIFVD
jgi:flap endonuclease-1